MAFSDVLLEATNSELMNENPSPSPSAPTPLNINKNLNSQANVNSHNNPLKIPPNVLNVLNVPILGNSQGSQGNQGNERNQQQGNQGNQGAEPVVAGLYMGGRNTSTSSAAAILAKSTSACADQGHMQVCLSIGLRVILFYLYTGGP